MHETGSVSRAAKRVHLTQSALSHQIKALQTYYGLPVIQRRGQSMELTEVGKRLVSLSSKVLEEIQAAERDIARISQQTSGSLRIALECHTCFDWLMPVMDEFRRRWPEVEIHLRQQRQCDFGIGARLHWATRCRAVHHDDDL